MGNGDTEIRGFLLRVERRDHHFSDLNAENGIELYTIEKRTKELDNENNVFYVVHYENEEGLELKHAFYYDPSGGGEIRLKNQKTVVWTRAPKL